MIFLDIQNNVKMKQKKLLGISSIITVDWLPDAENITSDGMMNKQTQTFNF